MISLQRILPALSLLLLIGASTRVSAQVGFVVKHDTSSEALKKSIALRNLTLTPAQVDTIKKIRVEFFKRQDRLNAQQLPKKERHGKSTELQEWHLRAVRAVLTPDQHKQFDIDADSLRTVNAAVLSGTLRVTPVRVERPEKTQ